MPIINLLNSVLSVKNYHTNNFYIDVINSNMNRIYHTHNEKINQ